MMCANITVTGRVVGTNGQPLSGATVHLTTAGAQTRFSYRGGGSICSEGRVSASGHFALDASAMAPWTDYVVWAVSHESADGCSHALIRPECGAVDIGVIELEKGASLSGRVVDTSGRPIVEAIVRLLLKSRKLARAPQRKDGWLMTTDATGAYSWIGAPTGAAQLVVSSPQSKAVAVEVSLQVEVACKQDFVLEPGCPMIGKVQDEHGEPVSAAVLMASASLGEPGIYLYVIAHSDGSGRFALNGLGAVTDCSLRVWSPDHILAMQTLDGEGPHALTMRNTPRVELRVCDAQGAPLTHYWARVFFRDPRRLLPAFTMPSVREGIGTIACPDRGPLQIEVRAPGRVQFRSEPVEFKAGIQPVIDVRLGHGATVRGRVVDHEGQPVSGASVNLQVDSAVVKTIIQQMRGIPDNPVLTATTDSEGQFHVELVREGECSITISHTDYAMFQCEALIRADRINELEVIKLERGVVLSGSTTICGARFPAYLRLFHKESKQQIEINTDDRGEFEVSSRLPSGEYTVMFEERDRGPGGPLILCEDRHQEFLIPTSQEEFILELETRV